jgi:hypothetical protein
MKKGLPLFGLLIINSLFLTINSNAQAPAIEWQKSIGGTNDDAGNSIFQTSDGGYIVAGNAKSNDGDIVGYHGAVGTGDFLIVKLDNTGAIQWQKSLGGTALENGTNIQQTTDGGYIVTGMSMSTDGDVTGNHGSIDCWVVKLMSNGDIDWQKSFGGSGVDYGLSIKQTNDGYIIGSTAYSADGDIASHHGASSSTDIWLVKVNNAGALQWEKSYGGTANDFIASIGLTSDGFIVSGKSNSTDGDVTGNHGGADYWVIKLDTAGVIQWQKSLGGSSDDGALSIQQTNDGGYVMAGTSYSNDGDVTGHHGTTATMDYWVVKLLSNGNIDWQKSLGGTMNDGGTGIWQTTDNGYFVSGHSYSNDGDITGHHGSTTTADIWVLKLSDTGVLLWQESLGGTSDELNAVFANQETSDGGFVIAGTSKSTDGDVTGHHGTNSTSDCWVVKLVGNSTNIESRKEVNVSIFPNPSNGKFIVEQNKSTNATTMNIYNAIGKEVLSVSNCNQQNFIEIDLSGFSKGIYFVKFSNASESFSRKIVVE